MNNGKKIMSKSVKLFFTVLLSVLFLATGYAGETKKRTFTEDEFISVFSGKPKARVVKYIGEPDNKEIAIKPKGAQGVVGSKVRVEDAKQKDKVEMWYYNNIVEYSPGKTYKFVEITMINDRVVNLGFFNQ
ncbi:MAG: hypothetical protein O3C08_05170 [Proteobacteria bacterium]|jgi:hypothetical protein|nr:hypothetical protein [Pseudomonadota bacterium]MDA1134056.1 hypothetical protein [Pseudomonadota bacterium]